MFWFLNNDNALSLPCLLFAPQQCSLPRRGTSKVLFPPRAHHHTMHCHLERHRGGKIVHGENGELQRSPNSIRQPQKLFLGGLMQKFKDASAFETVRILAASRLSTHPMVFKHPIQGAVLEGKQRDMPSNGAESAKEIQQAPSFSSSESCAFDWFKVS